MKEAEEAFPDWTFLTNHAHVLLSVAADPHVRVRDIAERVGITERAVLRILGELEASGYLTKERDGRRNQYKVKSQMPLRHPIEKHQKVSALIALVQGEA
ncbi:MAG: winged helix-turn-helix transcriptional regulator [Polyangiaceae bacterium]|nr:winged helix-turn-helix transcriptional regulator [Polyangiaceae bacterium]